MARMLWSPDGAARPARTLASRHRRDAIGVQSRSTDGYGRTDVPGTAQEPYPTPIQEAFAQTCEALGADRATCACAVKQVEATVPASHLDEYEHLLAKGKLPARILPSCSPARPNARQSLGPRVKGKCKMTQHTREGSKPPE